MNTAGSVIRAKNVGVLEYVNTAEKSGDARSAAVHLFASTACEGIAVKIVAVIMSYANISRNGVGARTALVSQCANTNGKNVTA